MRVQSDFGDYEDGIELVEMNGDTGTFLVCPSLSEVDIGDIFFIREKPIDGASEEAVPENGLIVQVIEMSSAKFPASHEKVLFRLMEKAKASELKTEIDKEPIDEIENFKQAKIKVRSMIVNSGWQQWNGSVTTRNIDVFRININFLLEKISIKGTGEEEPSFHVGDIKGQDLYLGNRELGKISLITGNKGTGKSHVMKGLVNFYMENRINTIVFDFNNEYTKVPEAFKVRPMENFRFRLDDLSIRSFIKFVDKLAVMPDVSKQAFSAEIDTVISNRKREGHIPDLNYLRTNEILREFRGGGSGYDQSVRNTINSRMKMLESYKIIMSENEALLEDLILFILREEIEIDNIETELEKKINNKINNIATEQNNNGIREITLNVGKLRLILETYKKMGGEKIIDIIKNESFAFSTHYLTYLINNTSKPLIISFEPFSRRPTAMSSIIEAVLDFIRKYCREERKKTDKDIEYIPNYPVVAFEEAHMYIPERQLSNLLSVVRHVGIDAFFVTNTPSALPETTFRLVDNLIMHYLLNENDIRVISKSGLPVDKETIEAFAKGLREYHAFIVSAKGGITGGFPLVCKVRDFGLEASGETRSPWDRRI